MIVYQVGREDNDVTPIVTSVSESDIMGERLGSLAKPGHPSRSGRGYKYLDMTHDEMVRTHPTPHLVSHSTFDLPNTTQSFRASTSLAPF
jgi:hypothetical protein